MTFRDLPETLRRLTVRLGTAPTRLVTAVVVGTVMLAAPEQVLADDCGARNLGDCFATVGFGALMLGFLTLSLALLYGLASVAGGQAGGDAGSGIAGGSTGGMGAGAGAAQGSNTATGAEGSGPAGPSAGESGEAPGGVQAGRVFTAGVDVSFDREYETDGTRETWHFDENGNLTGIDVTTPMDGGGTRTRSFDSQGRPTGETTDPAQQQTTSSPPAPPRREFAPEKVGAEAGDQYRQDFDDGSYDIRTRNSDGGITIDSYDANGNPTSTTTVTTYPNGTSQSITTTADGKTTVISHFDANGEVIDSAVVRDNGDGTLTRTDYDSADRITGGQKTNPDGSYETSQRNDDGSVTSELFTPDGTSTGTTTWSRDPTGSIVTYVAQDGTTTTTTYDSDGNVVSVGQTRVGTDGQIQTTMLGDTAPTSSDQTAAGGASPTNPDDGP